MRPIDPWPPAHRIIARGHAAAFEGVQRGHPDQGIANRDTLGRSDGADDPRAEPADVARVFFIVSATHRHISTATPTR